LFFLAEVKAAEKEEQWVYLDNKGTTYNFFSSIFKFFMAKTVKKNHPA
jgi:hypothetical protein